jgi:hypothetical protein
MMAFDLLLVKRWKALLENRTWNLRFKIKPDERAQEASTD